MWCICVLPTVPMVSKRQKLPSMSSRVGTLQICKCDFTVRWKLIRLGATRVVHGVYM
jgi:hypothetical protein